MSEASFIEIDHSGDVAIEAWGATPAELFANATAGLLSLVSTGPREEQLERAIAASASRSDDLLVDWLGQVILAGAAHGEVYSTVRVDEVTAGTARGVLVGARADGTRREFRFDVKAATYHGLVYDVDADGRWHAHVVFDL